MVPPRWARRLLAPVLIAAELALLVLFALAVLVGVVLAPFGSRRRVLRVGAMGVAYLSVELVTLAGLAAVWALRRARPAGWWEDVNCRLLGWALGAVLGAARRCLGFAVSVQDPPHSAPLGGDAPVLVLARHGGPGDSVALVWLLLERYRRRPRVVLKGVLQWEPLLDVSLNRLGACFLPTHPSRGEDQAPRLGTLAAGLGGRDALLLFPEGGNWTSARHTRAIARLRADRKHRAAAAAELMRHVLPPRPAGVFAVLDARPGLAVVVFAHTGLDTLTSAGQAWRAVPFDQPMSVRWWPAPGAPAAGGPGASEARLEWLTTEWAVVDEWIDAQRAARGAVRP